MVAGNEIRRKRRNQQLKNGRRKGWEGILYEKRCSNEQNSKERRIMVGRKDM
jgi:hypothetical protein